MNHEKPSTTHTQSEAYQPRLELTKRGRRAAMGAGALLAAGIAFGVGSALHEHSNQARAGSTTETPVDHTVTEVVLEDGASLRSDPEVADDEFSNQLDELDLGDASSIVIPTEAGIHIDSDENGNWRGIYAEDLSDVVDVDVEADKDGVVWVSEQRSSVETDTTT